MGVKLTEEAVGKTEQQDATRIRLRRYVERHQLVSVMNDTKWRRAVAAVVALPEYEPAFRVRCLGEEAVDRAWDPSFPWHVPTPLSIEWLELNPVGAGSGRSSGDGERRDFTDELVACLADAGVSVSLEAGAVRVWGYLRPGESVDFVQVDPSRP